LAQKSGRPVTFGWGPRFLHSTGQFHKGGQTNGVFLQITADAHHDLAIPGESFSFHTLLMAQALGDALTLNQKSLQVSRLHMRNREIGVSEILLAAREIV
jgi:glucose-6-phosphate isomerase